MGGRIFRGKYLYKKFVLIWLRMTEHEKGPWKGLHLKLLGSSSSSLVPSAEDLSRDNGEGYSPS